MKAQIPTPIIAFVLWANAQLNLYTQLAADGAQQLMGTSYCSKAVPALRSQSLVIILLSFLVCAPGLTVAAQPQRAPEPWVGAEGIEETMQQIMERDPDYLRPPKLPFRAAKKHPLGRIDDDNLFADNASPDVPRVGDDAGQEPPISLGQSTSVNFTAATLNDTLAFPPDSMGAVGPSQVIVAVNGRIRSFDKSTGFADGALDVNPDVFFSSVMTPPTAQNFTSDPRIRYDRLSGRWFLIIIDVPGQTGTQPNRILFAVSDSGVITPQTVWGFFQFQHDLPEPTSSKDNGKFADYPTLGIDANALYIGINIFGTRGVGKFSSTTAFVVRKSSLLSGGPILVTPFRGLTSNNPNQSGSYTPQGVDNHDPNAAEGYFIGVASALFGQLVVHRVTDPGGNPSMPPEVYLSVPLTGGTIPVPHLGNTGGANGRLDGLDRRLIAAHIRDGHLWTCANIAVNNTGSPAGTDTRMGVRWYELGGIASGQTPSVIQSGTLYEPSGGNTTNQRHYWMGSIMVSGQGHALLGFSTAGETEYINAGYAGRLIGDPLGALRMPVLYTASSSPYNPPSNPGGSSGRRWGDYSYTVVDPDDDMTMWTFQEWCHAPNSYAVQVVKVLAPPPATPVTLSPSAADAGQSNLNLTLTGAVVDGSGFFDPGPGFPNHVTATVNGGGVTVNTVTFNNPSNLTLNISVALDAAGDTRSVTVVNPDGQSQTSPVGLLTINALPQTNNPPLLTIVTNRIVDEETLLSFMTEATDPDGDDLAFSLGAGTPSGADVNATNGVFTWTPLEAQGPSTNGFEMVVTDDGAPPLSATQAFSVVVNEVNLPPQLTGIADRSLHAGMSLVLTNSATDADIPANILTYSLDPGAPPTVAIEPATGVLTWNTAEVNAGSTNPITVRVTDNGVPPLDDPAPFAISVTERPVIQSVQVTNSAILLTWTAIDGFRYSLEYKTNLNDPAWMDLPGEITALGPLATGSDTTATNAQRLYRVRVP